METLLTGQQGTPSLCPTNRAFFVFFFCKKCVEIIFFKKKCVPIFLFLSRCTLTRRVSDEVFDESFCEFFIPTEDCAMEAIDGSRKHQKTIQNWKFSRSSTSMISFCPFNSQIRKSEKQKNFWRELNSLRKCVVCLEVWIWQVMVWTIITWETSTMVPHCLVCHRTTSFTYMSD
jgi:hypothetical protein